MTYDVFVRLANLPPGINEFITEDPEGNYNIYLNAKNTQEQWEASYIHALKHIEDYDFEKYDVQKIEKTARV